MFKKIISFVALLSTFFMLVHPTISSADNTSLESDDRLSRDNYNKLIDEGVLNEDVEYEEWVELNDESLFEELDEKYPVSDENKNSTQAVSLKPGDVLVSNRTSSKGLTGHAGIVLNDGKVLHIAGLKSKPAVISEVSWKRKYGQMLGDQSINTKVFRVNSSSGQAAAAATWAKNAYQGKDYSYGFGDTITATNPTYCSKIVWQSYNYVGLVNRPSNIIVMPYSLPDYFKDSAGIRQVGTI